MDGQFGFLPWMQRGLINKVTQIDGSTSAYTERAQLDAIASPTVGAAIPKTVKLIGPGDILGLDPNIIIRSVPADGVFNFDDNHMAFLEFAEVDFLWRYTPAKANGNNQLRSWLALVVLKDGEGVVSAPLADGLPNVLTITAGGGATFAKYFHPQAEHWAWGHVQANANSSVGTLSNSTADFENSLVANPTNGISRLLCPRRLAMGTEYTAYLVPAFETGRLAGINADPAGTPSLKPSWDIAATIGTVVSGIPNNSFPVYYSWRFGTSALGDFETLARALTPRPIDPNLIGVKMDIANSGMGLNSLFVGGPPAESVNTVIMEGALMPATSVSADPLTNPALNPYTNALLDILDLNTTMKSPTYSGSAHSNPFVPATTFGNDDPIILPPMYGQWHAGRIGPDADNKYIVEILGKGAEPGRAVSGSGRAWS